MELPKDVAAFAKSKPPGGALVPWPVGLLPAPDAAAGREGEAAVAAEIIGWGLLLVSRMVSGAIAAAAAGAVAGGLNGVLAAFGMYVIEGLCLRTEGAISAEGIPTLLLLVMLLAPKLVIGAPAVAFRWVLVSLLLA